MVAFDEDNGKGNMTWSGWLKNFDVLLGGFQIPNP